jgi:hypothetical protein
MVAASSKLERSRNETVATLHPGFRAERVPGLSMPMPLEPVDFRDET